jgi:hypothetical protein
VAHWDDAKQKRGGNYQDKLEKSAQSAERLLSQVAQTLAPKLLDVYGAVLWEDQDECLEVEPKDIVTWG